MRRGRFELIGHGSFRLWSRLGWSPAHGRRDNGHVKTRILSPSSARLWSLVFMSALFFGTLMPGSWRDSATRPFESLLNLSMVAHVVLFAALCYLLPLARLWRVRLWHAMALALALAAITEGLQFFAEGRHPGADGVLQDLIGAALGCWVGRLAYRRPGRRKRPVDKAVPQTMTAPHSSIQPVTVSPRNNTP